MKVSDYIIKYLENYGIQDVFLLSGGGMMHLLDSARKSKKIKKYYNLNEQATSICADAYAQYTNKLSFCMLTTGPGTTNAITGVVSAYQDSTPMLVISGQVKTSDFAPAGVRSYGPQEVNIVELVKGNTKYAMTVTDKNQIKYHLQKAISIATTGRFGPVWLDIPLDVQAADVDESDLQSYIEDSHSDRVSLEITDNFLNGLASAKRPVILFGRGVIASDATELAQKLINHLKIPALCTWRAKELFDADYKYFFGFPGALAPRYSNFILQNCDFLLTIGARLNFASTAYNEKDFAKNAKKFIVDIDEHEINKLSIDFEGKFNCDASWFIGKMLDNQNLKQNDYSEWIEYCNDLKQQFPIYNERPEIKSDLIYGYDFAKALSDLSKENDIFVASPTGRVCAAMNLGLNLKNGQRFVSPMGLGSMGYALPSAIGTCIASGGRRTILFEGDGSLQHNIQELQLLKTYSLPIKLFVYNNGGYASIYGMQNSHFNGNLAGCNSESGVDLPSLQKIANAYELKYSRINNTSELVKGISDVLSDNLPEICEVMGDIRFEEIPRTQTKVNPDGSIVSSCLENLYPFI